MQNLLTTIRTDCTNCGECVRECAFLRRYGSPKTLAESFDVTDRISLSRAFECSLCGLCTTVCPERLDPDSMFLEMRREAVDRGFGDFPEHAPLLNYERLGTSRRFTLYRLPTGCRSVFFPGCALSGTRPDGVSQVFAKLRQADPTAGIVFDCCMKPSHSLGREHYVNAMFGEMRTYLIEQGIKEVLVACPNCLDMFRAFGQGLAVRTVYEVLAKESAWEKQVTGTVTVHDPCVVRDAEPMHHAVRDLLKRLGLTVEEMPHSGRTTVCCGKGGAVDMLDPELAETWGIIRRKEAGGLRIITYCAGCVNALTSHTPSSHLVDVLFAPEQTLAGKKKGAAAPFTYLNRIFLKRVSKRLEGSGVTRERTFISEQGPVKKRPWMPLLFLTLLGIGLIVLVSLVPVLYRRFKKRKQKQEYLS